MRNRPVKQTYSDRIRKASLKKIGVSGKYVRKPPAPRAPRKPK